MKKWGEQLDIRPPNLKIGGTCPLHPPLGLTPLNSSDVSPPSPPRIDAPEFEPP